MKIIEDNFNHLNSNEIVCTFEDYLKERDDFMRKNSKNPDKIMEVLFGVERGDFLVMCLKNPLIDFNKKIELFKYWYPLCENTKSAIPAVINFLEKIKKENIILVSDDDIGDFKKLPKKINLYRGMSVNEYISKKFGFTWSLSMKTAKYFATKYIKNLDTEQDLTKVICQITINKSDLIGYNNSRMEKEVYYLLEDEQIRNVKIINVFEKNLNTLTNYGLFYKKLGLLQ